MKAANQLRFAHPYILIFAALCSLAAACMSATSLGVVLWIASQQERRDMVQADFFARLRRLENESGEIYLPK